MRAEAALRELDLEPCFAIPVSNQIDPLPSCLRPSRYLCAAVTPVPSLCAATLPLGRWSKRLPLQSPHFNASESVRAPRFLLSAILNHEPGGCSVPSGLRFWAFSRIGPSPMFACWRLTAPFSYL